MTDPGRAVFLSYASQDAEAAQNLCNALRAAGIEVWFDQSELRGGDVWDASIRRQIKTCALFIPVISKNTHNRGEGYFRLEWKLAVDRSHLMASDLPFLLPVVVDETPDKEDRVPDRFREVQWTRLPAGANANAFVKHVRRLLAQDATVPASMSVGYSAIQASSTDATSTRSARPASSSFVPWIVGAVLILATGYLVAGKFVASKHAVPAAETSATVPAHVEAVSDKSIAVLPFTDMSEKHDQEYFGDGMAEEILDALARIPGLKVIGRTSSFQFKGKNEDIRTIGAKLNAAYVLEGSVRNSGDQVRITAQLINTRTGAHEWSETYDRHIGDVLKLQDAIAAVVVRELQLTVAPEVLGSHATMKSAEAYDLYLRGRHAYDRIDQEGLDEAVTLFQHALERDPTFADAAAWLSRTYSNQVAVGSLTPAAGFEQARRAATNALTLDPNNMRALVSMAWIRIMYDWDWAGAERELQKAATLAPGDVDVLSGEAELSADLGRLDDALRKIKAAVAQDPLDADLLQDLSTIQMTRGNLREAEAAMRRALDIRPTYAFGHYNLGLILLKRGDGDGALREMQQESIDDGKQQGLALAFFALGRKRDADAALAFLIKEQANANALDIAQVYAFRSQSDEAMHWLERAYAQKDPWLFRIKGDWLMKELEGDPRYKAFLRKMNLPE